MGTEDNKKDEDLVLIYTAQNEQEGRMLSEWLRAQGIEVFFRDSSGYAYDGLESVWMGRHLYGLHVLEHLADTARTLIQDYQAALEEGETPLLPGEDDDSAAENESD
jgi:hypothetical protein